MHLITLLSYSENFGCTDVREAEEEERRAFKAAGIKKEAESGLGDKLST
jgi:hypothetical protein